MHDLASYSAGQTKGYQSYPKPLASGPFASGTRTMRNFILRSQVGSQEKANRQSSCVTGDGDDRHWTLGQHFHRPDGNADIRHGEMGKQERRALGVSSGHCFGHIYKYNFLVGVFILFKVERMITGNQSKTQSYLWSFLTSSQIIASTGHRTVHFQAQFPNCELETFLLNPRSNGKMANSHCIDPKCPGPCLHL